MHTGKISRAEIILARYAAELTQSEAAEITWAAWEQQRFLMPLSAFELFLIKTGQQPLVLSPRRTSGEILPSANCVANVPYSPHLRCAVLFRRAGEPKSINWRRRSFYVTDVKSASASADPKGIEAAYAEMIYHYTNAAAMLSIVTTRTLWLTHVDFVNDRQEFRQPLDRFRTMIDHRDSLMPWATAAPPKYWEAFNLQIRTSRLAYVACFSRTGNSLSQFRLYGLGTGYSLGLRRSYLERFGATICPGGGAGVVECDYSTQGLYQWCQTWAREFFETAKKVDSDNLGPPELMQAIFASTNLFDRRIMAQLQFKSSQFEVEQEVRFYVLGTVGKLCWRTSRAANYVIPYLELELPNETCRTKITPGPNHEEFLANQSASQLTQAARAYGTNWEFGITGMSNNAFRYGL